MRVFKHLYFLVFIIILGGPALLKGQSVKNTPLTLWYNQPANNWGEALPLGNGTIGAMVSGGVQREHLYLNESSVWSGEYHFNENKEMPEKIKEIRQLLFEGNYKKAEELVAKYCTTPNDPRYGSYQPLGDLYLNFKDVDGEVKNYRRTLDLNNATSTVEFTSGNATFKRESFISAPENVMVIKLTCDKKQKISFDLALSREKGATTTFKGKDGLLMQGTNDFGGSTFSSALKIITVKGSIATVDGKLSVSNADEVLILFTASTDFWGKDPTEQCEKTIAAAAKKSYKQMRADHIKDYRYYFDRVSIDLGSSINNALPMGERVKKAKDSNDNELCALFFQYGRYLLISSSRPGGLPANLQGIWNKDFKPAWFSDFTVNINFEMNYWPAEVTNLSELTQPMFSQIERMYPAGKKSARERYGMPGWEMSTRSTPWGVNELRASPSLLFQDGAAWLCTHLWEHYLYTNDKEFLKKYYPIIKDAALFYDSFLIKDPKSGWLVSGPSTSPENRFKGPDGKSYSVDMGTTMSTQIVYDIFTISAKAAQVLDVDKEFAENITQKRSALAPMRVGSKGQLLEWMQEYEETEPQHRHVSHLYGLFPSNQISPATTPELSEAAKKSLTVRGDGGTGWSKAWKVCFWARLLDGDHAYKMLMETFNESTLPNLFNNHPPFQIDGNLGNTAGIAEMLMQSQNGEIVLLPALPTQWKAGSIKGLVGRGGFIVDLSWENNKLVKGTIFSKNGGECRVSYSGQTVRFNTVKNQQYELDQSLISQIK
ncbi:glycoside hydrolase N-terminal domain-containing protein [Flavobacterium sp. JAS]|uniref:glycoside hydrolase family 95 protein n=1 Tax=Flavobacterium sp. JAS TaxID=2897329 RepID=UPI001E4CE37F|nr:glycoside hydrolase family 95 protein [Flavobacterium sp. JAS]MCD0472312.1 glycoside hydrolase family 95 protein [Flavobacterium sp. JAS]